MEPDHDRTVFVVLSLMTHCFTMMKSVRVLCQLQDILCNDCNQKGTSRFHWLYHKCEFCGSYNTRVIKSDSGNPNCPNPN